MLGREIKIVMTLDDKDVSIKTVKVGEELSQMQRHIERTAQATTRLEERFTGLGQKFRDITLAISVARFAFRDIQDIFLALPNAVIKSSSEIERMTTLMAGLSKAITRDAKFEDAAKSVKFVFDMAQRTPFAVGALADSFVKLKVGGIDPTNGSLQALADSVARFGGNSESLKRASIAIQQMSGKGVVSMEELRQQLGEAIPDAMESMAIGAGLSMQELAKHVAKGEVAASKAIANMLTVMRMTNAGASAEMMQTWSGMTEQLSTKWELFKKDIGDDGFFKQVKGQLQQLLEAFDSGASRTLAQDLGSSLSGITTGLTEAVRLAMQFSDYIKLAAAAYLGMKGVSWAKGLTDSMQQRFMNPQERETRAMQLRDSMMEGRFGVGRFMTEDRRGEASALLKQAEENERLIALAQNRATKELDIERDAKVKEVQLNRQYALENLRTKNQELQQATAAVTKAEADRIAAIKSARTNSAATLDQLRDSAKSDAEDWKRKLAVAVEGERTITAARVKERSQLAARLAAIESSAPDSGRGAAQAARSAAIVRAQVVELDRLIASERQGVQVTREIADAYQRKATVLASATTQQEAARLAAEHANDISNKGIALARQQEQAAKTAANAARDHARDVLRNNAAIIESIGVGNQAAQAHQSEVAALTKSNEALRDKATQLARVTPAMRMLSGAIAGMQTMFNAFGGWVTVAAAALAWLGTKLWEFVNRFKEAEEIRKRIMSGAAPSNDDLEKEEAAIKGLEERLNAKVRMRNSGVGNDDAKRNFSPEKLAQLDQEINELTSQINKARQSVIEGRKLQITQEANDTIGQLTREGEREVAQIRANMNKRLAAIKEENERANRENPKGREKNDKTASTQQREAMVSAATAEAAYWDQATAKAKNAYDKALNGGSRRAQQIARDTYNAMADRQRNAQELLKSVQETGSWDKFTGGKDNGRMNSLKQVNPLERAFNEAEIGFQKQRLQLNVLKEDAKSLEDYKRQAMTDVIEKIMNGGFDYTTKGEDKKSDVQHYVGGMEQRKKLMTDFLAFMQQGKGTVDQFIASRKELTDQERKWIETIILRNAEQRTDAETSKALSAANAQAAAAQADLTSAMDDYNAASNRLTGVDKMEVQFARLAAKLKLTAEQMANLKKEQTEALRDTALAGVFRYGQGAFDLEEKNKFSASKLNGTRQDEYKAEFDYRMALVQREYDAQMAAADKYAKGSEKYEEAVTAAKRRYAAERTQVELEYQDKARTQLARLAQEWGDTTEQINQSTGNWANSTLDYITGALSGVKGKFRDFAASIMRDIGKIALKDLIGKQIVGAFDGLGSKLLNTFSSRGNGSNAAAQGAAQAATATAANAAAAAITSMASATNSYTTGSLGQMIAQAATWLGIDAGKMTTAQLAEIAQMSLTMWIATTQMTLEFAFVPTLAATVVALQALAAAAATAAAAQSGSAASSFFANGGIMTSAGSLPLKMYANGGVANTPQVAVFGEGRTPEAYVPLPDGRSIPVTMRGNIENSGQGGQNISISIVVNNDGSEQTGASGDDESKWKQMAQRVKGVVREELATQKRQGGMLWK
jgi:tape measure domain-containing protein